MKISSSAIMMASQHSLDISHTREESLRFWVNGRANGAAIAENGGTRPTGDRLSISASAREAFAKSRTAGQAAAAGKIAKEEADMPELTDEERLVILLLEKLLGVKIKLPGKELRDLLKAVRSRDEGQGDAAQGSSAGQPARAGWGFSYDYRESYREEEHTSFKAAGIIRTADGKEIEIEVELNMSREFASEQSLSIRAGDAKAVDPLVINFDGPAAAFTKTKFCFDLDSDGSEETISFLRPGSGFLMLDKDGDGKATNGSELFGPVSGDGFAELAAHDSDGNGWIDEDDPVYERLRIWTKDAQGKDVLFALGQKGVGAIYLGNVRADFGMKDSRNVLLAENTRAGVFLKEDGTAGTVQQMDLAAQDQASKASAL